MSNNTKVKADIKDERAIRSAVVALQARGVNIELIENEVPRLYSESKQRECGKCDFVLRLPNSRYDVGLKRNAEGKLDIILDTWMAEVAQHIGSTAIDWKQIIATNQHYHYSHPTAKEAVHVAGFMSEYTKAAITNAAQRAGHSFAGISKTEGKSHVLLNVR